jgi:sterol desaturase/sphingolipid hydroxylase (fatty acid hydroxylase superfamily)
VNTSDLLVGAVAFLIALPVGTLIEYILHRFVLHARSRTFITRRHRLHHKSNAADTLWGDFRDFMPGMVPFCWLGFLHSVAAGVGFALGGVAYIFILALVHKLSHERPKLVFWMVHNAHELHHGETPRQNYGIVTRFWDRVFRTYANERRTLAEKPRGSE